MRQQGLQRSSLVPVIVSHLLESLVLILVEYHELWPQVLTNI